MMDIPRLGSMTPRRRVRLMAGWHSEAILRGIGRVARDAEWILEPAGLHQGITNLDRSGLPAPDGLLTMGSGNQPAIRRYVLAHTVPLVEMSYAPPPRPAGRVLQDFEAQGELAGRTLADHGYRHMVFAWQRTTALTRDRRAGLRRAVIRAGGRLTDLNWEATRRRLRLRSEQWLEWLADRIAEIPPPIALLAASDEEAVYVLEACRLAGRLVPEQVAVAGFDNDETICEHGWPPLSSVDVNLEELGFRAATMLNAMLRGAPAPARPVLIPPRAFITRQSSDLIAIPHTGVAIAVRHMLANLAAPTLTIDDVAHRAGMSRRQLDRAFQATLGCTAAAELSRLRIDHAKTLLHDGRLSKTAIARACGFSNAKHLRRNLDRASRQAPSPHGFHRYKAGGPQ